MKKITLFVFLLFSVWTIQAQRENDLEINRDFSQQMQAIFGQLETDRVPYGILSEYAFPFADLAAYDGILTDSTLIDMGVFSNIYKTLMMGRIHPKTESDFVDMEIVSKRWATYRKNLNLSTANEAVIVLSGLLYSYASIPEESFKTAKITHRGNAVQDLYVNSIWQNPYVVKETVAITPPLSEFNTRSLKVTLPRDLFLTNQRERLNIQADFGDGKGFRPFPLDSVVSVKYIADGRYNWVFKIERVGRQLLQVKVPIFINNAQSISATNVMVFNGEYSAVMRIEHAPGHNNKIIKPLIVAEGFDPGTVLSPEKIGGDMTLRHFISSVNRSSDFSNEGIRELLTNNLTQEYDIVYVDWGNGIGDIRKNAETLEKVIDWVNTQKQVNGSVEPNVLLGQSMGGLISKYALVKMEQKNKGHNVRLFVAHDSPFQGANTPVSAQMLSRHLLKVYLSNPAATGIMEILIPFIQGFSETINSEFLADYVAPSESLTLQDSPAALQMTKYHVKGDYTVSTSIQTAWQNELDAIGYPQHSRNVAISNGNLCGLDNGYNGGSPLFKLEKTGTGKNAFAEIAHHLGASIWGITSGNLTLGLVSLIPGKAKIDYLIDLRAIPEQNTSNRVVYRGKARYHVLVWDIFGWRPSVSTDIVPLKELSVSNQLYPLETFAGGSNSIQNVGGNIDFFPIPNEAYINPTYGFVPVTSALDIKRINNTTLTISDNRKRYYNKQNLTSIGMHTAFSSFVTERVVGNENNFEHISFSPRNGFWFSQELNGENGEVPNCDFICAVDEQVIIGNSLICQSEIYQTTLEAGSYQWEILQGAELVSLQVINNNKIKLTRINSAQSGLVILQLSMFANDCGTVVFTKELWVGKPKIRVEVHSYGNYMEATVLPWSANDADLSTQQANAVWESSPPTLPGINPGFFNSLGFTARVNGGGKYWGTNVKVTVGNPCGSVTQNFGMYSGLVHADDEGANVILGIMPTQNPNEYEVVASIENGDGRIENIALLPTDKVDIYVHNLTGQLIKTVKESRIDLNGLQNGTYILNAIVNDNYRTELTVYKR